MPVPRRKIDAKLQSVFACRTGYIAYYVAFAVFPRAALDAVIRLPGGPEAKAVMMLGHQHHVLCTRVADGFHPLIRIELSGIECGRAGSAIAPLTVKKSIGGEVKDDAEFKILPGGLIRRGL